MTQVLAELVARITADATELKKALAESERAIEGTGQKVDKSTKSISESFKEIGKAATIMGAAITASMGAMILSFDRTGSELHDLALKTGVSVEALAGLKYAAEQNGASLGTVEMAIKRTAAAMQGVRDGTAESVRAFDRMGVSLEELAGLNPEQQFMRIASAIAEIPDPMTRAATAQDLFGRSGMDMLPMLSQGADGLKKMMEQGVKYNKWSTDSANLADSLGDSFTDLKTAMSGATNTIAAALAPAIKDLTSWFTNLTSGVSDFLKEQPELTKALGGAALAMGILATAIGTATLAMSFFAAHPIGAAVIAIGLAVGAVVAAVIAVGEQFGWWGKKIPEVINPLKSLEDQLASLNAEVGILEIKAKTTSDAAIKAFDKLGDATVEALKRRNKDLEKIDQDSLDERLQTTKDFYDDVERESESSQKSIIRDIEDMRDAELDSIRDAITAKERWYNKSVKFYEDEKDKRIESLRDSTNEQVKNIQKQIDDIESAKDLQIKAERDIADAARIASLKQQWNEASILKDKVAMARITGQIVEAESDIRKRALEETRQAEIDALRDKIDLIRDDEDAKKKQYQKDLDDQTSKLKTELDKFVASQEQMLGEQKIYWKARIDGQITVAEQAKEITAGEKTVELTKIEDLKKANKTYWDSKNTGDQLAADATILITQTNQEDLVKLLESYNPKWQDAGVSFGTSLVKGLQSTKQAMTGAISDIMKTLEISQAAGEAAASAAAGEALDKAALEAKKANIIIVPKEQYGIVPSGTMRAEPEYGPAPTGISWENISEFASGGTVPGAIGEPQLAMVHGGEVISQPGKSGITIVFEGPVYGFNDFESKVAQAVKDHAIRGGFYGVL